MCTDELYIGFDFMLTLTLISEWSALEVEFLTRLAWIKPSAGERINPGEAA